MKCDDGGMPKSGHIRMTDYTSTSRLLGAFRKHFNLLNLVVVKTQMFLKRKIEKKFAFTFNLVGLHCYLCCW